MDLNLNERTKIPREQIPFPGINYTILKFYPTKKLLRP